MKVAASPIAAPPIVVANSPIPFVVTGPGIGHRRILIRSDHANLDLAGLDGGNFHLPERVRPPSLLSEFSFKDNHFSFFDDFIVRSRDVHPLSSDDIYDDRFSHLSFAWRGLASPKDMEAISDAFDKISWDLLRAIDESRLDSIEWQVAPIVSLCNTATKRMSRQMSARRSAVYFVFLVYAGLILALVFNLPDFIRLSS